MSAFPVRPLHVHVAGEEVTSFLRMDTVSAHKQGPSRAERTTIGCAPELTWKSYSITLALLSTVKTSPVLPWESVGTK